MKLTNYINSLILIILIFLTIFFNSFQSISSQIESILPQSEKKELLKEFNKFQNTKKIFLTVEGITKESLTKIKSFEKDIEMINGIKLGKFQTNKYLVKHKEEYLFYLENINEGKLQNTNIITSLKELKSNLINSDFSFTFNKKDPLNLLEKQEVNKTLSLKNNHLFIKDFAYISIFNIEPSIKSIHQYEDIYDSINKIINKEKDTKVFSSIFYFVENSRIIKNDVNKIIILSTIALLLLYLIILRNIKLLVNTLITLASSVLLSLFICSLFFDKISIFVLVFGISISTVAIDYMFHNYVHNYYEQKKAFNKDVFLGMTTTVGAFMIFSFVSFDLIKQICYFSIISLLFSYIQFTFLYPEIGFLQKNISIHNKLSSFKIKPIYIIIFSSILIIFSINKFNFDSNLKNLNVENLSLKQIEKYFNDKLNLQHNILVLIKAKSINKLISNARLLKKQYPQGNIPLSILINKKDFDSKKYLLEKLNFNKIKSTINKESLVLGFKENYFENSYTFNSKFPEYTSEFISKLGFEIQEYKGDFISYANLPKDKLAEFSKYDFIETISIKSMFEQNLLSIYNEIIIYGFSTILFILIMVFLSTKGNYLTSLTYLVFPISCVLSLSFFIDFNILHLFMTFIVLSISIDFGIYLSSKEMDKNTYKAIVYSLLSTFAGFGVLIFSKINALFSIGIIATIGILSITFLLLILKRPFNDSKSI